MAFKANNVKVGNKTTRDKGLGWERDNGFGANQE